MKRLILLIALALLGIGAQAKFDMNPVNDRFDAARTGATDAEAILEAPVVRWTRALEGIPDAPLRVSGWLIVPSQIGRDGGTLNLIEEYNGRISWAVELHGAPIGTPAYETWRVVIGTSDGSLTSYSIFDGSEVWNTAKTGRVWSSVLAASDRLFASTENGIFALNPMNGGTVWRVPAEKASISPVLAGDLLIVSDGDALLALDPSNGAEQWRISRPGAGWTSAGVIDGMLVAAGTGLVAYDLATQDELWTAYQGKTGFSAPILLPELVIVGHMDTVVFGFDRLSGEMRWRLGTTDWAASNPVYSGGVVYFGVGNHIDAEGQRPLYAVDAYSSHVLWTHMADGLLYYAPAVADRAVWYTDSAGNVVALTADAVSARGGITRSGVYHQPAPWSAPEIVWETQLDSPAMAPVAVGGVLYVPMLSGELAAFDAVTGEEFWTYHHPQPMASPVAVSYDRVFFGAGKTGLVGMDQYMGETFWSVQLDSSVWSASPLAIDGAVVTGSDMGIVYALEQADGAPRWETDIGVPVLSALAADAAGRVVVAASWEDLTALDMQTGAEVWRAHTNDKWGAPAADASAFYLGTGENTVVALDVAGGHTLWTFRAPRADFVDWSGAVVTDDLIYIGHTSGTMFALDKHSGREVWRAAVEDWATTDPILADGLLIFGVGAHANQAPDNSPRHVYALNAATGEQVWTFPVDGLIYAGAALWDGTLYVTTVTGHLYALREK